MPRVGLNTGRRRLYRVEIAEQINTSRADDGWLGIVVPHAGFNCAPGDAQLDLDRRLRVQHCVRHQLGDRQLELIGEGVEAPPVTCVRDEASGRADCLRRGLEI